MKLGIALSATLTAACGFSSPKAGGAPDGGGGTLDGCVSFSAQLDTCKLPDLIPVSLGGMLTFNTDTGKLKDGNDVEIPVTTMPFTTLGGEVRAIAATTFALQPSASLRATGVRGFAIIATETITLGASAVIDVSAGGAGYRSGCGVESPAAGTDDGGGGAGGGGGGFGAAGGLGGDGDSDGGRSAGGMGGSAAAAIPAGPTGGCSGAPGGKNMGTNNEGGVGGLGGGTVYLVAGGSIAVGTMAGVNAGGGGGGGGTHASGYGDAGGGGGGSGGSIFLESPVIQSQGTLAANGGGGGEGSGGGDAGALGMPGALNTMPAQGGQGGASTGADGGGGGARASTAGGKPTQVQSGGGGGGGGGVGLIRIASPGAALGAKVSPDPQ